MRLRRDTVRFMIVLLLASSLPGAASSQTSAIDQRIDDLLSRMTLDEKVGQLVQYSGFNEDRGAAIREGRVGSLLNVTGAENTNRVQRIAVEESRLGIPLLFGLDVIHGYRTIFPIPLATASSWDPELVTTIEAMAAREARSAGVHWTFAPMVDISRDARWGRIAESLGFQAIALGGFQLGAHLCTTEPMLTLTERGRIGDSNAIFLCWRLAPSLFSLARGTKGCLERLSTERLWR